MTARVAIVIPCYNEASRFDARAYGEHLRSSQTELVFVDDGSTDQTASLLREFVARTERCSVISLGRNGGKAEAVRSGVNAAIARGTEFVGYWDADLATPLDAIGSFVDVLQQEPQVQAVIGSRVQLLGRVIRRRPARHYLGRVFATLVSLLTALPVYDSQCGAKVFRSGDVIKEVFRDPFVSRWFFDIEVLVRIAQITGTSGDSVPIHELPLRRWIDVDGSKLGSMDNVAALIDLMTIARRYGLRRMGPRAVQRTVGTRAG